MNRDEILNMPAGREMDTLVAEKIMGWERGNISALPQGDIPVWHTGEGKGWKTHQSINWSPSTVINSAWEVVEKILEKPCSINVQTEFHSDGNHSSCFIHPYPRGTTNLIMGHGSTAPLAICRAALLAVMDTE